jgi:hypothetical protein
MVRLACRIALHLERKRMVRQRSEALAGEGARTRGRQSIQQYWKQFVAPGVQRQPKEMDGQQAFP